MAYSRGKTEKVKGDGLDAVVDGVLKNFERQIVLRNADDEQKFFEAVINNNLSTEDQLNFRKEQLLRVGDSREEKARITGEIKTLKKLVEQEKFSAAYTEQLSSFESGTASIDSVINWLSDQMTQTADPEIRAKIQSDLVTKKRDRFTMAKNALANQTQFAINDKTESILNEQIGKVNTARNQALLSGDTELLSTYDLHLQALSKAKTEAVIQRDINNFTMSNISGYATATKILDSYNDKVRGASGTGSITVDGITYASAQEFWSYKRDSYVADQSASGFFGRLANETTTAINTADSKNLLSKATLDKTLKVYDKISSRPELKGYETQITNERQAILQTGVDKQTKSILDAYSTDYDLTKASNALNQLKNMGANVDDSFTRLLTTASSIKDAQVSNIVTAAQGFMAEGLDSGAAVLKAISMGAGAVFSPKENTTRSEKDIASQGLMGGFGVDPRTTIQSAPVTTPQPTAPTGAPVDTAVPGNGSIVDFLDAQGKDSSYTSRSKLAAQYGIANYSGSPEQNTQLLKILSTPKPPQTVIPEVKPIPASKGGATATTTPKVTTPTTPAPITTTAPKTTYQGASVQDYLTSIGQDGSYAARTKLAASKGITNYAGTPEQNTQLLKTLRGF